MVVEMLEIIAIALVVGGSCGSGGNSNLSIGFIREFLMVVVVRGSACI